MWETDEREGERKEPNTVKTWEVYKISSENPNARFKRLGVNSLTYLFVNGKPKFICSDGELERR